MILLACLAVLVALGAGERLALVRARRAVPIRIHVNGTRGKSTVTRLVAAALREAGIPTLAKVTGTEPRLILPDGSEQPVVRWAPASIMEQSWVLRKAARLRVRALVVECMAVHPDLQWVSERDQLHSTHGVITNVRLDHTEVMGSTLEDIARSLANTTPRRGTLVVGGDRFRNVFSARCAQLGSRLVVETRNDTTEEELLEAISPDPMTLAVALATTRELGIDAATALKGMSRANRDPGTVARGTARVAGHVVEWLDATAANDPESLDLLVAAPAAGGASTPATERRAFGPGVNRARPITVYAYNHRDDRAARLATFATASPSFKQAAAILVTGDRPAISLLSHTRRQCPGLEVRYVRRRELSSALTAVVARSNATRIVYCGNTRGFVRPSFDA